MFFECDVDISKQCFLYFRKQYMEKYPDFKGIIRRAARSFWIAEVIDEDDNLTSYPTAC